MSTTTDTGGDAFPNLTEGYNPLPGMTLLDHFAGLAMSSMLNDPESCGKSVEIAKARKIGPSRAIAEEAYTIAAAMVAEKRRLEGGAS